MNEVLDSLFCVLYINIALILRCPKILLCASDSCIDGTLWKISLVETADLGRGRAKIKGEKTPRVRVQISSVGVSAVCLQLNAHKSMKLPGESKQWANASTKY